jgi:hypothetical protein
MTAPQPNRRETPPQVRESAPETVHASRIEADRRDWIQNLSVAAGAGVFLSLVGALGTDVFPFPRRLLYWVPLMVAGGVLGAFMAQIIARFPRAPENRWAFGAVLAAALTVPATAVVWLWSGLIAGNFVPFSSLPGFIFSVFVISAAMTAIMVLVQMPGRVTHAPAADQPPARPRFFERFPPKLRGGVLYAVSAEDHYLRLHTSKGADLILMRLSDAIGELEGVEGAQTHRSWWVAKDAVESVRRDGDKVTLVLKGGAEAPVSRPNVRPLRGAGWF